MWVVISSLCLLFFRHFRFNDVDVVRGNKRKRPQSTAGSPANSGQSSSRHSFWRTLQIFWSDDRIQQWKSSIFTENKTEERALFAPKRLGIAEDTKANASSVFWLRKYPRRPYQSMPTRPELPMTLDGDFGNVKLSPVKPRKNFIQWIPHRLTALSGAADIFSPGFDEHIDNSDGFLDVGISAEEDVFVTKTLR
ncbi:predicted protein [Histoplasma capsulatum var. duboisii H88]|uniref:Predicted protein n=1 Tax=Ajellomyces capsulatus (strain H88) TaxID=544711 RepID=F0UHI2_AJEC8|nr:predicted protein [Histoplasma capsulatum var. duboisii H88]